MHALFVRTLLVGCPVVIVLGCMYPGPRNNNNNNNNNSNRPLEFTVNKEYLPCHSNRHV